MTTAKDYLDSVMRSIRDANIELSAVRSTHYDNVDSYMKAIPKYADAHCIHKVGVKLLDIASEIDAAANVIGIELDDSFGPVPNGCKADGDE